MSGNAFVNMEVMSAYLADRRHKSDITLHILLMVINFPSRHLKNQIYFARNFWNPRQKLFDH